MEFAGLSRDAMVARLCDEVEQDNVDQYYAILFPDGTHGDASEPDAEDQGEAPDRARVERIVAKLDSDTDGNISAVEAKVLLSQLLGIPEDEIPDDHEDVVEFAGLAVEAMVDRLCQEVSKDKVDLSRARLVSPES